jgi:putative transposase
MTMDTRYTFRFYPTEVQKRQLEKEFGCARYAYNWGLNLMSYSYRRGNPIGFAEVSREWTKHRKINEWMIKTSSVPPYQAIRNLELAFKRFFMKKSRYPKFKSKKSTQSVTYSGWSVRFSKIMNKIEITKLGRLHVRWSREFASTPSTVTITKNRAGQYFISIVLDEPEKRRLAKTGESVGIDLGITNLATLSNGEKVGNPRYFKSNESKLARLHRDFSRKVVGSKRWHRHKIKLAKAYLEIVNTRKDAMHKLTTNLVRRFDVIAIEDLNVGGMVKNRRFSKLISYAGFGMFRRMLTYKCAWYGRELRLCDRFHPSSKKCSVCGRVREELSLKIRSFTCEKCGEHHDRDVNAAKNILAAGQAVTGRGERVSPTRSLDQVGGARRSVNQLALHGKSHATKSLR